jgi:predicted metal-binding membrane protein
MSVLEKRPVRDQPRDPAPLLWAVTAGCWVAVVVLLLTAGVDLADHDTVLEQSTLPVPLRLLAFTGAWTVMLGAMMLPTTVPMARMFVAVSARQPRPGAARVAFAASYLLVWVGFALVALAGDTLVHGLVHHWAWLEEHEPLILATTLVLAGLYQLSPLKDACLRACRSPLSIIGSRYRGGASGGWRVGLTHALNCLGCCWALMLVMFATGVGSLLWMLALTAVMVAEKSSRAGARLVRPIGVTLVAFGVLLAIPMLLG